MASQRTKKEKETQRWIEAHKINNFVPKPARGLVKKDPIEFAAKDISSEPYPAIGFVARRNSGKSTALICTAKSLVGLKTKVILFVATVGTDPAYKEFVRWLKAKHIPPTIHTSIYETVDGKRVDVIKEFIDELALESKAQAEAEGEEKEEEEEDQDETIEDLTPEDLKLQSTELSNGEQEPKEKKEKKDKKLFPDFLVICDDLGAEIRSKSISTLVKTARHAKIAVLISSQNWTDAFPDTRRNMTNMAVFAGEPYKKLQVIHGDTDTAYSFKEFHHCYDNATAADFGFLYVNIPTGELRKCFHTAYKPAEPEPVEAVKN